MNQKFCTIGLTLGSFDFYLLLIDLHAYSEVFATEPNYSHNYFKLIT